MSFVPIKKELSDWLSDQIKEVSGTAPDSADYAFEAPQQEKFGDLSTALLLKLAKQAKKNPRALADDVLKRLKASLPASKLARRLRQISVEGPGFLNFYYSDEEITRVISRIHEDKERFGRPAVRSKKILLEFVSANPTGPLTVAHGRQAALGDSLARILRFCGHQVTTEYYNNDEGVQITTLGKSLLYRVGESLKMPGLPDPMPENYYQGDYLKQIAGDFIKKIGEGKIRQLWASADEKTAADFSNQCRIFARDTIMKGILQDLKDFDTHFGSVYSQEALGKSGKVEKTLEELKKLGKVKEEDGALWLKSTEYGDDKDRVLVKSDGNYTYLTPDIAYHHEKFNRGFEEIIDILGPDHHGYISRLKASQAALGHDPEAIHVLIAQLVTLYEGKKQVRMSTRAGEFVTLRQILDEVGKDAGRFFFVMRKFDAHLDFDLELAKTQTPDNPVFYIQYAHARIESIKANAPAGGGKKAWDENLFGRLSNEHEMRLMRLMSQYEEAVLGAEKTLEPYRLVPYLMELAAGFHRFYTENRVVTEDADLTQARLLLVDAAQTVLRSGLNLLGVSAPLKM